MISLIEQNRTAIEQLCRRYRVARLELFGSAAQGGFDPDASDLDFLVEFAPFELGGCADAYFGLRESLEALLQRPIDLVTVRAIQNPYFLRSVNQSRTLVYAA